MTVGAATDVRVRSIAAGGDGVGLLPDGRVVFVPRSAPGDVLRLRAIERHGRFARAEIAEVLEAGPDRVDPPCHHYVADRCGGCQLMHLSAPAQRAARAAVVGDAVRRLGRIDAPDPPIEAADAELGYRARITLTVTRSAIGYHRLRRPDQVFPLVECLLAEAILRDLYTAVAAARTALPTDTDRLVLWRDRDGGLHVTVETRAMAAWTNAAHFADALADAGSPATVWWHPRDGAPRAVAGADSPWPAAVFEQVHPAMARRVRGAAVAALGEVAGKLVWDLYAGIGETTQALAAAGARVVSVERNARAVQMAESLGPVGPDRRCGLVETVVGALPGADRIILNPPRTGVDGAAVPALLAAAAERVVYVSCDPATLARDLRRLEPTYRLIDLRAFDQFPQTAHVESVAVLERR
jgi:23S rRNA (uracil1939-C5)-methyltransferase